MWFGDGPHGGSIVWCDGGTREIPLDSVFDLLGDRSRRDLLLILSERDPPTDLEDLARRITSERDEPIKVDQVIERQHVAIMLHHRHLPMLARWDIVDYDTTSGQVSAIRLSEMDVRIERTGETRSLAWVLERTLYAPYHGF